MLLPWYNAYPFHVFELWIPYTEEKRHTIHDINRHIIYALNHWWCLHKEECDILGIMFDIVNVPPDFVPLLLHRKHHPSKSTLSCITILTFTRKVHLMPSCTTHYSFPLQHLIWYILQFNIAEFPILKKVGTQILSQD